MVNVLKTQKTKMETLANNVSSQSFIHAHSFRFGLRSHHRTCIVDDKKWQTISSYSYITNTIHYFYTNDSIFCGASCIIGMSMISCILVNWFFYPWAHEHAIDAPS